MPASRAKRRLPLQASNLRAIVGAKAAPHFLTGIEHEFGFDRVFADLRQHRRPE
jgi:hypothetical protein